MNDLVLVRVRVMDAWDDIVMTLPSPTPVAELKRRALDAAKVTGDPSRFLVKFRGAELRDESRSLGDEQIPDDAALIVLRRRRVAVR